MIVKDLMEFLEKADPNLPVILSKDNEGNNFRTLWLVQEAAYVTYNGDRIIEVCNQEDAPEGGKPCVVLWPS